MKKIFGVFGAAFIIIGLFIFLNISSLGIIGGTDGSTVFFATGKTWVFPVITGALLIIVSYVVPFKKKK